MRGLVIEEGRIRYAEDLPEPVSSAGEVRVQVLCTGVCATDLALQRGYMDFAGVPGHEFCGVALDGPYAGQRVVGEINTPCGACPDCRRGLGRHCSRRTVLGILGRQGAFAERIVLPHANLHPVPDDLPTEVATFTEPAAAAFEIVEQLPLSELERALVLGDGRLGLLCAQVLARAGPSVELAGRHPERAAFLSPGIPHRGELPAQGVAPAERWDLVVEATGSPSALSQALRLVRPRGTLVLKTTAEAEAPIDLAQLVVDEITLVGSRCGPFAPALAALAGGGLEVAPMIDARYRLEEGAAAFEHAGRPGTLKVLVEPDAEPS